MWMKQKAADIASLFMKESERGGLACMWTAELLWIKCAAQVHARAALRERYPQVECRADEVRGVLPYAMEDGAYRVSDKGYVVMYHMREMSRPRMKTSRNLFLILQGSPAKPTTPRAISLQSVLFLSYCRPSCLIHVAAAVLLHYL